MRGDPTHAHHLLTGKHQQQSGSAVQQFLQNHLGLAIVSGIALLMIVILTFIGYQMRAAGLPLRPITYIGVFFAIIVTPQLAGQIATTLWPKPKPTLNVDAFAGREAFTHPAHIFGPGVDAASLRDARPVFPEFLSNAEVAQLLLRETGEMTLAARFQTAKHAAESAAGFWTAFALTGTSGSEEHGWWGTRQPVGDILHMKRIGSGLALWTGATKDIVRMRIADVRLTTSVLDQRPAFMRLFDHVPVQIATVVLLVLIAATWFLKGASWAGRIDAMGTPVTAGELSQRLSRLSNAESFRQISNDEWELIVYYETIGEEGRYRYLMRLDPQSHRVIVSEFIGRRQSPSASYNWRKETGMTFFRKEAGFDLQEHKGPIVQTITSSGWDWQPVMWDVPNFLRWLT